MRRATAALLHRLPHPVDAEVVEDADPVRHRRRHSRRGPRARMAIVGTSNLRVAVPVQDPHGSSVSALERRAREAGGPIDNACYSCACGLVFAAAVSTTVNCPHCGADQAW